MDLYEKVKSGLIRVWHKAPHEVRFWFNVNKDGSIHAECGQCWDWTGRLVGGYGVLFALGKVWKAHRYSYQLHNGVLPKNECVLHRCDRPSCVNPAHLFLGSQLDNIADMVAKKRQAGAKGVRNKKAKLTEDQVREIRRSYVCGCPINGAQALAKLFGISETMIYFIANGKAWNHVE